MKIYQSSLNIKTFELIAQHCPHVKINLLRSFSLGDKETIDILRDFSPFIETAGLDSGVYSKFYNENVNHTLDDYSRFLEKHADMFKFYFNYDEDFEEKSRDAFGNRNDKNLKILEDRGFKPVPVIHLLNSDIVNFHIEQVKKYPFVAMGSSVLNDSNFDKVVEDLVLAGISVHAFKIGSADRLKRLPICSSDCSSHAQWTKAGRCVAFDNDTQKDRPLSFRYWDKNGIQNDNFYLNHKLFKKFLIFVEEVCHCEIEWLVVDSNYRTFINSMYFLWLEKYLNEWHEKGVELKYPMDNYTGNDIDRMIDDMLNETIPPEDNPTSKQPVQDS